MKIIALKAENIKRLVAVEIKPNGNIVEITGRNGQGKTSVLDSIWWVLAGASNVQKSPIRTGEESAYINLDLGDMIVTRTFKYDSKGEITTTLAVNNKEGVKFSSPQAMLDKLTGDFAFDPLAFARASSDEQFNKLRTFVPDVDFKAIDAANKKDYEARTDVNRRAKEKRAAAAQIMLTKVSVQPVDESKLVQELANACQQNSDIEIRKNNRKNMLIDIANDRKEAELLIKRADELQAKLDAAGPLPAPIDVTALQAKIAEAGEINTQYRLAKEKEDLTTSAIELEKQSADYTKAIEQRDADKQSRITAAKLPVQGISFGDGQVMLNGVPFEQASDAEQLRASIAIAMALNPKLRVIRVRDGSLLDDDSMKILAQMAEENDCQVWVERVDGSGKVGFILEDGHVRQAASEEEPVIDG